MAGFKERYSTDRKLEEEGVWVDYGDGLKVQVRRLNSKHSRETRRKLEKPYTAQFRNRDMPESLQEELLNKQVSQSVVVNWEGVEDPSAPEPKEGEQPKMLPYSQENVLRMVTEFPDFRDDILTASMSQATFQKEQRKEAEKNSKSSSSGS
jgi:hypothetical protein